MSKYNYKKKDKKKIGRIIGCICLVLFVTTVVAFFVTTAVLAHQHGVTMVQEWQSWPIFGGKKLVEEVAKLTFHV